MDLDIYRFLGQVLGIFNITNRSRSVTCFGVHQGFGGFTGFTGLGAFGVKYVCETSREYYLWNGLVLRRYVNGSSYEGYFVEGKREGHGLLKQGRLSSEQASMYVGQWLNDRQCGYGVYENILKGTLYERRNFFTEKMYRVVWGYL